MTLQQLEYILALDLHRHYVKAAEHCFVTQPTITLQVKKLEDEIGVQIFDRSKTPLEPTVVGETIIAKARKIISETRELKDWVKMERESLNGDFNIGIIPTISPYIVPKFTGNFINSYPNTHLHINEMQSEEIIKEIKQGKLDMGILVTPINDHTIREEILYHEPFVFYGNPEGMKHGRMVEKEEVERLEGLWLLNKGHCFRNQVLNICKSEREKKNVEFQSGSIETLKRMVDNYGGFTLIPELAINVNEEDQIHLFKDPLPKREVSIIVNKGFSKEALIDAVKGEIKKVIPPSFIQNIEEDELIQWR